MEANKEKNIFVRIKETVARRLEQAVLNFYMSNLHRALIRKELYAEYEAEKREDLTNACNHRIQRYAYKLKKGRLELEVFEEFEEYKAQKTAAFTARQEKKDSLKYRALRQKNIRANIDPNIAESYKKELEKQRLEMINAYRASLDAQYAEHLALYPKHSEQYNEILAQNNAELEGYKTEQQRALEQRLNKFSAANKKRIEKTERKITHYRQRTDKHHSAALKNEAMSPDAVLRVENLCMYFGGVKAVDGLDFEVKKGEIFGLIGPNGAGKTTVFNCITQFYKPTKGTVWFVNSEDELICLNDYKVHDICVNGVARTFQNIEVIREISVLDNLLVAAHRQYTTGVFSHLLHLPILKREEIVMRRRAIKILEFLGIAAIKDFPAFGLPYGILKKIEIARTLMNNPKLIILDEPAAGLNDTETAELSKLIRKIAKDYNCTILLVEHDMGLVMEVCDRILAISFGKPLAIGTPEEIQANKDVQTAYLGVSE